MYYDFLFQNGSYFIGRGPFEKQDELASHPDLAHHPNFLLHMQIPACKESMPLNGVQDWSFVVSLRQFETLAVLVNSIYGVIPRKLQAPPLQVNVAFRTSGRHLKDSLGAKNRGLTALQRFRGIRGLSALRINGDLSYAERNTVIEVVSRELSMEGRFNEFDRFFAIGCQFASAQANLEALNTFRTCQNLARAASFVVSSNTSQDDRNTVFLRYLQAFFETSQTHAKMLRIHSAVVEALGALNLWRDHTAPTNRGITLLAMKKRIAAAITNNRRLGSLK